MRKIHLVLGAPISKRFELNNYQAGDKVVGADLGALTILEAGYPLDLAVGDFDSISKHQWEQIQAQAEETKKVPAEKDMTDGELAMTMIGEMIKPDDHVYVYQWYSDGRVDHFISILWWCHRPEYRYFIERCHFISEKNRLEFLLPGIHHVSPKAGFDYLSVIQMTSVADLAIKNFKYELGPEDSPQPVAWISNEFIEDCTGEISFTSGILLLVYAKD